MGIALDRKHYRELRMSELTLTWIEAGQVKQAIVGDRQSSKHPGTFIVGRNPEQCDILLADLSVSRLHAEIFFDPARNGFYLRKLPEGRLDPIVDGHPFPDGEAPLKLGSHIWLGSTQIAVVAIDVSAPPAPEQPSIQPAIESHFYKLRCPNPNCFNPDPQKLVGCEHLRLGCPWCGYSLAAAQSVLLPRLH
jgi:Inner membrane component of T3SS, cytoplasmic domain